MNTELNKDDIYKIGKKLVNNELTAEQKEHNTEIQKQIDKLQQTIENMQKWLDMTPYSERNTIEYYKREIKQAKRQIKQLKVCFYK